MYDIGTKDVFCEFRASVKSRITLAYLLNYNVLCITEDNVLYAILSIVCYV